MMIFSHHLGASKPATGLRQPLTGIDRRTDMSRISDTHQRRFKAAKEAQLQLSSKGTTGAVTLGRAEGCRPRLTDQITRLYVHTTGSNVGMVKEPKLDFFSYGFFCSEIHQLHQQACINTRGNYG